jgi:hypothetical protein
VTAADRHGASHREGSVPMATVAQGSPYTTRVPSARCTSPVRCRECGAERPIHKAWLPDVMSPDDRVLGCPLRHRSDHSPRGSSSCRVRSSPESHRAFWRDGPDRPVKEGTTAPAVQVVFSQVSMISNRRPQAFSRRMRCHIGLTSSSRDQVRRHTCRFPSHAPTFRSGFGHRR